MVPRLAFLALMLLAASQAAAQYRGPVKSIKLPLGYKPEGIAKGWGNYYYVGSLSGKISRVDVTTGKLTEIISLSDVKFDNSTSNSSITSGIVTGLEVDPNTRLLFAAGGLTGGAWVVQLAENGLVDTSVARPIQFVDLSDHRVKTPLLINDVALRSVKRGSTFTTIAYFTDSLRSSIYRVAGCPAKCAANGPYNHPLLVASPSASQVALNGIIAPPLPNGNFIVGDTRQGKLFKVTISGKKVTVIPVRLTNKGAAVTSFPTDGLLSVGKKIFAVTTGSTSSVVELSFNAAYTSASIMTRVTDRLFSGVSTIAAGSGGPMYAVNARLRQCPAATSCPRVAFQLVRVDGFKL